MVFNIADIEGEMKYYSARDLMKHSTVEDDE